MKKKKISLRPEPEEETGIPTLSRWLRATCGGVYAAAVASSGQTADSSPQPTAHGFGQPDTSMATLIRLTPASLRALLVDVLPRVSAAVAGMSACAPASQNPPLASSCGVLPVLPLPLAPTNPIDLITTISQAQPSLAPLGAAAAPAAPPTTRACCLNGHEMSKLFRRLPSYYASATCDQCDLRALEIVCPHFFHCSVCQYDLCHNCTRSSTSQTPFASAKLTSRPLVAHSLRLLEGFCALRQHGAAAGPPAAFGAWAAQSTLGITQLAPMLALVARRIGLSAAEVSLAVPIPTHTQWAWLEGTAQDVRVTPTAPELAPAPALASAVELPPASSAPGIVSVTCLSASDPAHADEVKTREEQRALFTAAVRRDLYAVLLQPTAPHAPGGTGTLGAALLGAISPTSGNAPGAMPDTFAYVDAAVAANPPAGFVKMEDEVLLASLQQLGETSPTAIAVTKAFEAYLARKALEWSTDTVRQLSVDFLTAFAVELTPRLDINHRMRSVKLSAEEVHTLSMPPFSAFVDQGVLRTFQTM